jgi:hypothetical protein
MVPTFTHPFASLTLTIIMSTPAAFNISISDDALLLLKKKLELATLPDELEEAGWNYGAPLADVKNLLQYWKDKRVLLSCLMNIIMP